MQLNTHPGEPTPRHSSRRPIITLPDARLSELNTPDAPEPDSLLHILVGPLYAVNNCRHELHLRGYAEPNDWSIPLRLLHTANVLRGQHPSDVMRVLRRRIQPRLPR